ncbi:MAG: tetratricopeptide repeat protein [Pseudomonadales bacterium]|nr:tetratricopeptide repeat protein [Pseudomonadales bacterium]
MKFLSLGLYAPVLLGGLLVSSAVVSAQNYNSSSREISINKAVAIYEYMRGNHQQAIVELATDANAVPMGVGARNRKLMRMEQIQKTFESSLGGNIPESLHNALWLDISELHKAEDNCTGALDALAEIQNISAEDDHEVRLLRVTCMLEQHNLSQGVIAAAESIAVSAEGKSISIAYIYHNIASAAHYMEDYDNAQRYYLKSMEYLDDSAEGIALASRIRLSLAWSYYESLRYDFSLNHFSKLRIDNEWVDISLLGYGWAAFKNGEPGLAIESWRQLIYLPFQSISVYEGYLAIPYALESKNAYSEALRAYQRAADLYADQIQKVDELGQSITADAIEAHAVEYARSKGEAITPLHPLLVDAFSRGDFQDVFDVIAEVDKYQQLIEGFEGTVKALDEARIFNMTFDKNKLAHLQQGEVRVEENLAKLFEKLNILGGNILALGMQNVLVSFELKSQYKRYLKLERSVDDASGKQALRLQSSLQRVRGILLGELEELAKERGESSYLTQSKVVRLAESYRLLEQRYQAYWAMKPYAQKTNVGEQELIAMQKRIDAVKIHITGLKLEIDELLLLKTREALDEQKQQLVIYENQARIALARLSEEFYQRGGRKLWR